MASSEVSSEKSDIDAVVEQCHAENIPLFFTVKSVADLTVQDKHGVDFFFDKRCWSCTDFVDVSRFVALRYELAASPCCYSVSFFDESKNLVSGKTTESILDFSLLVGHSTVPKGATFAKFINFLGSPEYYDTPKNPFVQGFLTEEDYVQYKKRFLKHDGLKIVCLGDSLTEGHQGFYKQSLSYPYYLAKFLGCETVNHGRSSFTASDYYYLFSRTNINVSDADFVLIMLGSNGGLTFSGDKELLGYKSLISEVKKKVKPECKVILLTPTHATVNPERYTYGWFRSIENAVSEVRKLADGKDFHLIDVFAESPIQSENEDIYQPVDGVHMCAAGYEALARFLAPRIEAFISH